MKWRYERQGIASNRDLKDEVNQINRKKDLVLSIQKSIRHNDSRDISDKLWQNKLMREGKIGQGE